MGMDLAKQALKITHGQSSCQPVRVALSLDAVTAKAAELMPEPACAVLWEMQDIVWGKWDGHSFYWTKEDVCADDWQEIRIFHADGELHLRRSGGELVGRFITDGKGGNTDYIDSFSRLWGERDEKQESVPDGFVHLYDASRKIKMTVPCEDGESPWLGLTTRNYIGSDAETGLSGYTDYRFVGISGAKGVR